MATNCLGPFLLNRHLEPTLKKTAASSNNPLSVRIVWIASMIAASVPKGGITMNSDGSPKVIKVRKGWREERPGNILIIILAECDGKLYAEQGR